MVEQWRSQVRAECVRAWVWHIIEGVPSSYIEHALVGAVHTEIDLSSLREGVHT